MFRGTGSSLDVESLPLPGPSPKRILRKVACISFVALCVAIQVHAQTDPGQAAFSLEREGKPRNQQGQRQEKDGS